MLKHLLISLFVLLGLQSVAQRVLVPNLTTFDDKRIHFGFTLGINTMDMGFSYAPIDSVDIYSNIEYAPYDGESFREYIADTVNYNVQAELADLLPGFTVGIITNFRVSEYLDMRFNPGLSFGSKRISYNIPIYDRNGSGKVDAHNVQSIYLDFPLMLKYKSKRIVNQRPYMISGMAYRLDISKRTEDDLLQLDRNTFFFEIGMGWDSYLSHFRFSTEVKYSLGLNNILKPLPDNSPQLPVYTDALSRITANMLTLSFHFE